jgi:hypothetical protein
MRYEIILTTLSVLLLLVLHLVHLVVHLWLLVILVLVLKVWHLTHMLLVSHGVCPLHLRLGTLHHVVELLWLALIT